ncbi:DUF58 domain-containing protein [Nocardioides salsibiostraticola]
MDRLFEGARVVRPLGWTVLGIGVVTLGVAAWFGWRELTVVGVACVLVCLFALPFLFGRTRVRVALLLEPSRIAAGGTVSAAVEVTNDSTSRMLPTTLELPVGSAAHRYGVPALAAGATHQEAFTIRTDRRGVIAVGPATTRRGDPLGLFSRDSLWTQVHEVLVRPAMVPLDALGAGLLRDLEGVSTDAISSSDLAFHALREYAPGDDLRHVHWRSSAKVMGAGSNQLLVRQYLDTRRSHATIVVDDRPASWTRTAGEDVEQGPETFETAMSVTASIIVRAVLDDFEASFLCGSHASTGSDGNLALDAVCRATPGDEGLVRAAQRAARTAADTSLLFLVTGADCSFEDVLRAGAVFSPEVRRIAVIIDPAATAGVTEAGGVTVLRLPSRNDLPGLLHWSTT